MKKIGFLIVLGLVIFATVSGTFINKPFENASILNASHIK